MGDPASWRPSAGLGGSPGLSNPPPIDFPRIVVNELLANPIPPAGKKSNCITLPPTLPTSGMVHNGRPARAAEVPHPDGTVIAAGGYLVFDDTAFNPTPGVGASFTFNRNGEQAYVFSADAGGNLTAIFKDFRLARRPRASPLADML